MSLMSMAAPMLRRKPRLARVSAYDRGNLLTEARKLNRAGYSMAAVMMARVAVERQLKEICYRHPAWTERKATVSNFIDFLRFAKVVDPELRKRLTIFMDKASSIAHGSPTGMTRARMIIQRAAMLSDELHRIG